MDYANFKLSPEALKKVDEIYTKAHKAKDLGKEDLYNVLNIYQIRSDEDFWDFFNEVTVEMQILVLNSIQKHLLKAEVPTCFTRDTTVFKQQEQDDRNVVVIRGADKKLYYCSSCLLGTDKHYKEFKVRKTTSEEHSRIFGTQLLLDALKDRKEIPSTIEQIKYLELIATRKRTSRLQMLASMEFMESPEKEKVATSRFMMNKVYIPEETQMLDAKSRAKIEEASRRGMKKKHDDIAKISQAIVAEYGKDKKTKKETKQISEKNKQESKPGESSKKMCVPELAKKTRTTQDREYLEKYLKGLKKNLGGDKKESTDYKNEPVATDESKYMSLAIANQSMSIDKNKMFIEKMPETESFESFAKKTLAIRNNQIDKGAEVDTSVRRALEALIQKAIDKGASDIHFQAAPSFAETVFMYRIEGEMEEQGVLSAEIGLKMVRILRIECRINKTTGTQSGSFKINYKGEDHTARVMIVPTTMREDGSKVVIRLLGFFEVPKIGGIIDYPKALRLFFNEMFCAKGLTLISGTTGSGKSTTIASMIQGMYLLDKNSHIIMVEDPIEYDMGKIGRITQMQVSEHHNVTMFNAVRAAMRLDPDIIVIGEMRDLPEMKAAVKYAETGHCVIGTIHADDVFTAITRIATEDGIKRATLKTLSCAIHQHLFPKRKGGRIAVPSILSIGSDLSDLITDRKQSLTMKNMLRAINYDDFVSTEDYFDYLDNNNILDKNHISVKRFKMLKDKKRTDYSLIQPSRNEDLEASFADICKSEEYRSILFEEEEEKS